MLILNYKELAVSLALFKIVKHVVRKQLFVSSVVKDLLITMEYVTILAMIHTIQHIILILQNVKNVIVLV